MSAAQTRTDYEHITVARDGATGRLTLNRPTRRNALSLALMQEAIAGLRELSADPECRVIVLAGNGPAFSAGHDLSEMRGREPAFYDELFSVCTQLMQTIHAVPQPVIARVHGIATAAGCQLVATCDLAIAAEEATFATPGVKIGLFCSTPMVAVSRAVGRKRAMEMLLTGTPIDAPTAADWGLDQPRRPRRRAGRRGRRAGRPRRLVVGLHAGHRQGRLLGADRPLRGRRLRAHAARDGAERRRHRRAGGHRGLPRQARADVDARRLS